MLRMLLADDRTLFRETLSAELARCPKIADVLEASEGEAAVQIYMKYRPDVVIIKVDMSEADAFGIARAIQKIDPGARIIFLSRQTFDSDVEKALKLGARGYILESDGLVILCQAVTDVAEGGTFFSEPIRKRLGVEHRELKLYHLNHNPALASLTPREQQLLIDLGEGASLKEAALAMEVSYKTADNQKTSLMRKLDIHDRVELVHFAIREGLVSLRSCRPRAYPKSRDHAAAI